MDQIYIRTKAYKTDSVNTVFTELKQVTANPIKRLSPWSIPITTVGLFHTVLSSSFLSHTTQE